jgi:hypothetical protein
LIVFVAEDLAEDTHPHHGFAAIGAELESEMAEQGLGGVVGVATGVAGGFDDIDEESGEALAVFGGGGSFVENGNLAGIFKAGAGEFVETDGDGLAEVHGEMAGGVAGGFVRGLEHGDGGEQRAVAELVVGEAGFFRAEGGERF